MHQSPSTCGEAMTVNQLKVLRLLSKGRDRDLYEAGGRDGKGTGRFYVSYGPHDGYAPLSWKEVCEMEQKGWIARKWPDCHGCYVLTHSGFAKAESAPAAALAPQGVTP